MTTNETKVVGVRTKAAIKRLEDYLLTTAAYNAVIELRSDLLFVSFQEESSFTETILEKARQIFYWTDKLTVPHIDGFVHYYPATNTMLINLVHYEEICNICEKLNGFSAKVTGFDLNFHEYTFTYDVPGRSNLSYSELLEIEQIINPKETEELEHLSVFRMGQFYTLTIKHISWRN